MDMIIAITGHIGVGKTTTAEFFREHGFVVLNVDELGHELLDLPDIKEKIKQEFGIKILGRNLEVERKKLSEAAFDHPEHLAKLNSIVHPYLKDEIKKKLDRIGSSKNIIIDAALYEELEIAKFADKVILVEADIEHIYERLKNRYSKRQILNIMTNQNIIKKADFIIENNNTTEDLKRRVELILKKLG